MEMIDAVTGQGAAAKSLRDDNLRRTEDERVDELLATVGLKLDRAGLAAKTAALLRTDFEVQEEGTLTLFPPSRRRRGSGSAATSPTTLRPGETPSSSRPGTGRRITNRSGERADFRPV